MAKYDYNVFKACNDKYKGYGRAKVRIASVDMKKGVCQLVHYGCYGNAEITIESIETLVERYISSTMVFPFIANPSKLKLWSGFSNLALNDKTLNEIDAVLVEIREQYADITEGIGAVKRGLTFNLQKKGKKVVFSGMISSEIPFETKEFIVKDKEIEALKNEIKSYLFDTLDTIVNIS